MQPRRRRPDARRDEILRAAARLLAAGDRGGVSMEALAEAAGAAKGTVYRYFPSRAALVAALREQYAASLAALARRELREAAARPPAERWARFAEAMLDSSLANRSLHHALFRDEPVTEDRSMEPLRAVVREFLEGQIREGRLAVPRAEPLLRVLLDGFHGALVAVAHAAEAGESEAVERAGFLAAARVMGDALLRRG